MRFLRNAWYVAAWSHELGDQLMPRTLCGFDVVLYRSANGRPAMLADRCPHRFAPLHLGRRRGDNIECGYHGLQFDANGDCVSNPHGVGSVPKACHVASFPVEERHGVVWFWPGERAAADVAGIPDFAYLTAPERKTIYGLKTLKANYELIIDNLMDASHTQYVHKDLLGTDAFRRSRHEVLQDAAAVHSNYVVPDSVIPSAYKPYFEDQSQLVDYSVNFRWLPPALVRNNVSLTPVTGDKANTILRTGSHFMTPETDVTAHYFFAHTRNFLLDDAEVDARTRAWQQNGLIDQDGTMIEAVQAAMGTSDLDALAPVLFSIDTAAVRVRRALARLVDEEAAARQRPEAIRTEALASEAL